MREPKLHPSITMERVIDAVQRETTTLDNPGFCLACGEEAMECEPDAREYECEGCGERQVYGAAEILVMFEHQLRSVDAGPMPTNADGSKNPDGSITVDLSKEAAQLGPMNSRSE
jgi:hypothetical protein